MCLIIIVNLYFQFLTLMHDNIPIVHANAIIVIIIYKCDT